MLSVTVLHHDPAPETSTTTKRLIVDRMKPISDTYFDWVSTIETSSISLSHSGSSSASSAVASIDKSTIERYHQACGLNDHFLLLLKPINLNILQKINQRTLNSSNKQVKFSIQYSLNDFAVSVGYIQIDEYLVGSKIDSAKAGSTASKARGMKAQQLIDANKSAIVSEVLYFTGSATSDQPCIKCQFVMYDPLELINLNTRARLPLNTKQFGQQNQLLSRHFENISVQINQTLLCELDVSIIDRLYYLINSLNSPAPTTVNKRKQVETNQSLQNIEVNLKIVANLRVLNENICYTGCLTHNKFDLNES